MLCLAAKQYSDSLLFLFRRDSMSKYVCETCGYIYDPEEGDPENGIDPGTAFEDLPDDWTCPLCGDGKEVFKVEG